MNEHNFKFHLPNSEEFELCVEYDESGLLTVMVYSAKGKNILYESVKISQYDMDSTTPSTIESTDPHERLEGYGKTVEEMNNSTYNMTAWTPTKSWTTPRNNPYE